MLVAWEVVVKVLAVSFEEVQKKWAAVAVAAVAAAAAAAAAGSSKGAVCPHGVPPYLLGEKRT